MFLGESDSYKHGSCIDDQHRRELRWHVADPSLITKYMQTGTRIVARVYKQGLSNYCILVRVFAQMADFTPEEQIVFDDFRTSIGAVFKLLYEEKWDESLWTKAVADFHARHSTATTQKVLEKVGFPNWDAAKENFKTGPPPFVRSGWVSPLVGETVNLGVLDDPSAVEWIKGDASGRDKFQAIVVEFWSTWCQPCLAGFSHLSELAIKYNGKVKVIGINVEDVFGKQPEVDLSTWVAARNDMNYNVGVDKSRRIIEAMFKPGERRALPTAMIITTYDACVHFVGSLDNLQNVLQTVLV